MYLRLPLRKVGVVGLPDKAGAFVQDQPCSHFRGLSGQTGATLEMGWFVVPHLAGQHPATGGAVGRAESVMQLKGAVAHLVTAAVGAIPA